MDCIGINKMNTVIGLVWRITKCLESIYGDTFSHIVLLYLTIIAGKCINADQCSGTIQWFYITIAGITWKDRVSVHRQWKAASVVVRLITGLNLQQIWNRYVVLGKPYRSQMTQGCSQGVQQSGEGQRLVIVTWSGVRLGWKGHVNWNNGKLHVHFEIRVFYISYVW